MAIIGADSSGQLWQLTFNTDGSLSQTAVSAGQVSDTGSNSTELLQTTVNLCRTHLDLMPIADVGGFSNEPALSLCKDTLQELCAQPFNWKFNSVTAPILVTTSFRQDYLFAGAVAFTKNYGAGIDLASNSAIVESSNTVTVNMLEPHNFSVGDTVFMNGNTVAAYNSTFTQTPTLAGWSGGWTITAVPTTKSFQFTHATSGLGTSGAPGVGDFGWLEAATMVDTADVTAAPKVWPLNAVRTLKPSSETGRPQKIAVISKSNGVLTVRLSAIPGSTVYAISMIYQKRPPLPADLTATWYPFPDEFGFVYRQAFLARCYRYLNHPRADAEEARALAMIQKALSRDDAESDEQYVSPQVSLMGGYSW